MFGLLKPKLPVTPEQQQWVDRSFLRLAGILGGERLLQATVMLPNEDHFPDPYDCTEEALERMFARIATSMRVDPGEVDVTFFESGDDLVRELLPFYSGKDNDTAGLYFHDPAQRPHISINEGQLKDPVSLVATLAHELGHVILLRPGLVQRDEADMEPLNDLLTVFLGFGVFMANSAFRFKQFTTDTTQGWSTKRLGYLSEELFGYALARFALERGEIKPAWAAYLTTNTAVYFKQSAAWLAANEMPRLLG